MKLLNSIIGGSYGILCEIRKFTGASRNCKRAFTKGCRTGTGFWGILKTEMYYLYHFEDYETLRKAICTYIDFYNNDRYQKGPVKIYAQNCLQAPAE